MNQIIIQPGAELVTQSGESFSEEDSVICSDYIWNYDLHFQKQPSIEFPGELGEQKVIYQGDVVFTALRPFFKNLITMNCGSQVYPIDGELKYRPLGKLGTIFHGHGDMSNHQVQLVVYGKSITPLDLSGGRFGILELLDEDREPAFDDQIAFCDGSLYWIRYTTTHSLQLTESGFGTYGKTNTWKSILGG